MSSEPISVPNVIEDQGTGSRIIDFTKYRAAGAPTFPSQMGEILLSNPSFQSDLKDIVEGMVLRSMFSLYSESLNTTASPFDSLLIIDLKPDSISSNDINTLAKLGGKIQDRSEEISFDDGWDD